MHTLPDTHTYTLAYTRRCWCRCRYTVHCSAHTVITLILQMLTCALHCSCQMFCHGISSREASTCVLFLRLLIMTFFVVFQFPVGEIWPSVQAPFCLLVTLSPIWTAWAVCGKSLSPRDRGYRYTPLQRTIRPKLSITKKRKWDLVRLRY